MKGDYIYCITCNTLYKDRHEIPESRDKKVRSLCPNCHGTNTINANKELFDWERKRIYMTPDCPAALSYAIIKNYADFLVAEGIIDSYKIEKRQGRKRQHYLYNTTNYSDRIKKQMKVQGVTISSYKKKSKPLNKAIPDLSNSRGVKKPHPPSYKNLDKEVLGYRRSFDITNKDKKDQTLCNGDN